MAAGGRLATLNSEAPAWHVLEGDCLAWAGALPPRCASLVFCDPPYNYGLDYGAGFDDARDCDAFRVWLSVRLLALSSLLERGGSLWALLPSEHAAHVAVRLENAGLHPIGWLAWYETFGVNCTHKFNRCLRHLLWFSNKKSTRLADRLDPAIRRPSDRLEKYQDKRANPAGKLLDDVWAIPRLAGTHKERLPWARTQLPRELLRRVVAASSRPGGLVVDGFCGSGTTGVEAVAGGRRFLGIERAPDMARLARLRIWREACLRDT